jgi:amidohydrolase
VNTSPATDLLAQATTPLAHWSAVFRDLHEHPELSFQEVRTASIFAESLRTSGFEVTENVGVTGVVGVLLNGDGPAVMLRADMDGLPVLEETTLPYRSRATQLDPDGIEVAVMHACGHDMHVTALAAAADVLANSTGQWSGTLVVVGQPAEELARGARAMLADGLFTRFPRPDIVLGQHVGPFPVGVVGHSPGLIMSATTTVNVTIFGTGGHGSMPSVTVDPVVAAAYAITRLQAIVARETSADDPVVVTVAVLRAGQKSNIIPDSAFFTVNIRARNDAAMTRVIEAVKRIVEAESSAARSPKPPLFEIRENAPATVNTADAVDRVRAAHTAALPNGTVIEMEPLMGSEDFSEFGLPAADGAGGEIPYVFWFWGGMDPERFSGEAGAVMGGEVPGNHSALFELVDEATIDVGRTLLVTAALEYLGRDVS